jgi:prepilin-type N-terminal cleavage/methylation domain-containing protein
MKKIHKTKRGFTLIEMVLVIAIIIILAAVMFISISGYINTANTAAASVSSHNKILNSLTSGIIK